MLSSRLPSCSSGRRFRNLYPCYRSYSSPSIPTPQHSIYISKSTNPYFNLSFEDWFVLFRHKAPDKPLLLLYRDDPCVVIGRNQNPWKEVNLSALRAREGIPFIRRRSGGGTVYHDLGNTNFSIHLPRTSFDRHLTAQVILRAVRSLGIDATVNDRNDICVGKEKICWSAYKIVSQRAYHHGTMLISTQLDTLGDLLHNTKDTMETKGVASVRSPVRNLQQFKPTVTHEAFVDAVIHEFREEYEVRAVNDVDNCKDIEYIQNGILELPSWDWAYGQTPEFTYTVSQAFEWGTVKAKIRSKHGLILDCDLSVSNTESQVVSMSVVLQDCVNSTDSRLKEVERALQGRKYGFVSAMDILNGLGDKTGTRVKDVAFWLESTMNS
ncbi:Lipoyltransferase and lipoate-protein ligase [Lentinula detonsa]|uniref:Putative lipoate-protein ligase A n=1 Tax=Lentinula detonsa TaxID=2804962 RepID=A0A9W8NU32_9AGAR|nr:Lipoyltransferase and lipoate-protein ligase [Lentinula detonsa]